MARSASSSSREHRSKSRPKRSLYVEVPHPERVQLDKRAPRLDFVAHQLGEDLVGGDAVLDLHPEQSPGRHVHGRFPELLWIHLAQALVALQAHRFLDLAEQ